MTDKQRAQRNLNPHAEARIAMLVYGHRYSKQRGGSMDFWDSLSESDKQSCRRWLKEVQEAPAEANYPS